jgi:heme A synthase
MNPSQIYIAIAIAVLAIVAVLLFFVSKRKEKRLTPLAGLAFGFVLAGILFGENRFVGYGLLGIGVSLALIDIFKRLKNEQTGNMR